MTDIYGIKNCDTIKKTLKWLDDNNIAYNFHDYKKIDFPSTIIEAAIKAHGWEAVINRRGTTWRNLSDAQKESMNNQLALQIAQENPSIIKRPLLIQSEEITLGFAPQTYSSIFL